MPQKIQLQASITEAFSQFTIPHPRRQNKQTTLTSTCPEVAGGGSNTGDVRQFPLRHQSPRPSGRLLSASSCLHTTLHIFSLSCWLCHQGATLSLLVLGTVPQGPSDCKGVSLFTAILPLVVSLAGVGCHSLHSDLTCGMRNLVIWHQEYQSFLILVSVFSGFALFIYFSMLQALWRSPSFVRSGGNLWSWPSIINPDGLFIASIGYFSVCLFLALLCCLYFRDRILLCNSSCP